MRSDRQAQGALATEWQSTSADLKAESALQRRRDESSRTAWETIRLVVLQIFMTFLVVTFLVPTFWMISSSLKVSTEVFAHPDRVAAAGSPLEQLRQSVSTVAADEIYRQHADHCPVCGDRNRHFVGAGGLLVCPYQLARAQLLVCPAAGDDDAARCGDSCTPLPDFQESEMDRHVAAPDRALLGAASAQSTSFLCASSFAASRWSWKTRPRSTAPAASVY